MRPARGARRAIVHGALANVEGVWASSISVPNVQSAAGTGVAIVDGQYDGIAKMLVACNLSKSSITVSYSGNAVGNNVTVTVTTQYTPIVWFLGPKSLPTLSASSTMQVTH